jgi:hypothetical protein
MGITVPVNECVKPMLCNAWQLTGDGAQEVLAERSLNANALLRAQVSTANLNHPSRASSGPLGGD